MTLTPDLREFVESFISNEVEFLVVGAHALAVHGYPRYTGDLEIFINRTPENAARIVRALEKFGFGSLGLKPEDFTNDDAVIQIGIAPNRIGLLTFLTGVEFDEALV